MQWQRRLMALLLMSGDEPGPRLAQFDGQSVIFHRKPLTMQNLKKALVALGFSIS